MPLLPFAPAPSTGGGSSPLTTKGDLFTHGSSDARLAVGTDGFVLNADSAQTLGIGWSTRDVNHNNFNIVNAVGVLMGTATWPTTSFIGSIGQSTLGSAGVYTISLTSSATFRSAWTMTDDITVNSTGGWEAAGLGIRPVMHFSNGQASQTATLIDGGLQLKGTDTLSQAFVFGAGVFVESGLTVTNAYGISLPIEVDSGGTVGTATFFRPLVQGTGTLTNVVGIDLTNLGSVPGTTWALKVGNWNSYFQGNTSFGSTGTPTYPVDATGTVRATDSSTSVAGFIANMTGTPAASTTLAGFSDTSSMPLGTNASAVYATVNAAPSITGASPTALYVGALINPAFNGSGTATKFVGAAIGSVQTAGTLGTTVGLDVGVTKALAGTTTWALNVGNYNSYHLGPVLLGASTFPTTVGSGGSTIPQNPVLSSNGTYTITPSTNNIFPIWLIEDTVTVSGVAATSGATVYGLAVAPTVTFSDGLASEVFFGFDINAHVQGTNTLNQIYGLGLNANVGGSVGATTGIGVSATYAWGSSGTCATLSLFSGTMVKTAGTVTTLIGLNLSNINSFGSAATMWGMQVGNYKSYHQGKIAFGGTSSPANSVDIQSGALNYTVTTMTYAATISLDVTQGNVQKTTTTVAVGNATINASAVPTAGLVLHVIITNDATLGRTITFGTNFKPSATLVGTASKTAVVSFISDGVNYYEFARTTGL